MSSNTEIDEEIKKLPPSSFWPNGKLRKPAHRVFNMKRVVKQSIITIHDPELGEVKFGDITLQDLSTAKEFNLSQDIEETLAIVYLMLKKADQSVELKDVLAAPADVQWKLIELCSARSPFLQKMVKTYGKEGGER